MTTSFDVTEHIVYGGKRFTTDVKQWLNDNVGASDHNQEWSRDIDQKRMIAAGEGWEFYSSWAVDVTGDWEGRWFVDIKDEKFAVMFALYL